jgi:DNA-binding beta-propeller fold protein YncE
MKAPLACVALLALCAAACDHSTGASDPGAPAAASAVQSHSNTLAASPDATRLYVVHPDADSVSVLDLQKRSIVREIALGDAPPAVDPASQRFDPRVMPRALVLDSAARSLFVTGERSGRVYAIDTTTGAVRTSEPICSEPIGVLVSHDDATVLVACSQDDVVVALDAASLKPTASVSTPKKPWALAWSPGGTLLVTHLLGPGVSEIDAKSFVLKTTWPLADIGPQTDPNEPHGRVRGIYDVLARPGSSEIWATHLMLNTDTGEPTLSFTNTVFPAVSILGASGEPRARLSVQAADNARDGGAFGDVVSGPRGLAFSADGRFAAVVDTDSEDLLLIDATRRVEAQIVRPLPGHMPEGVVWVGDALYVQERNTEDVAVIRVTQDTQGALRVAVDGAPIRSLSADPMPPHLREGQKLFYSANSDDVPITQNHWVACATCHIEGRSDAVTWLFAQGPRDTPSNAGGMLGTGFLLRTAGRAKVQDYWETIAVEQGGFVHPGGAGAALLDAIADYVNYAIPTPVPPRTDPALVAQGQNVFQRVGCVNCHAGPLGTDSGSGNPSLDLSGPVLLHDVGTCVTSGPWPDVAHTSIDGQPRSPCAFDTPALRGLWDSAPYLHDGSAATLEATLPSMLAVSPDGASVTAAEKTALIEYLKSL